MKGSSCGKLLGFSGGQIVFSFFTEPVIVFVRVEVFRFGGIFFFIGGRGEIRTPAGSCSMSRGNSSTGSAGVRTVVGGPMSKLLTLVAFVLLAYFLFSNRKRSYQVSAFSWKFASGIARRKGEECFRFEGDCDCGRDTIFLLGSEIG